ncbi:MAG: site-2 protease family protein [Candidatus Diapherotrites archaeon]|uniref:Site-2 protease family protein n=1 Tax=Candidatus Iainarchaeum sp. TaxID=3101447 RepID=A0A8T4L5P4_9ARCH|nr:site-2 protease family protein [Candidatus Diapherotrites archaeon]
MNQREIIELIGSWLVVSIAFAWVMKSDFGIAFPNNFIFALVVALVATGTGFILHELAHKYVAIRYGAVAEYYAWPFGLFFALVMAVGFGFVFAAPGAVYIFGPHIDAKQNGIISVAGPITNIIIGVLFFVAFLLLSVANLDSLAVIAAIAGQINLFLALFNLIPIGPLDGSKVFAWNKLVWGALFVPLALIWLFVFRLF